MGMNIALSGLFLRAFPLLWAASITACGTQENDRVDSKTFQVSVNDSAVLKKGYIFQDNKPIEITYVEEDGTARFSGDMVLPLDRVSATEDPPLGLAAYAGITKWANGRVPYVVPANFPYSAELAAGVAEWAKVGIAWVPRTAADVNFVTFSADLLSGPCGLATVGQLPKAFIKLRAISSALGCTGSGFMKFAMLHEMAHVMGYPHEWERADRDSHLTGLAGTSYSILPGLTFLGAFDVASVTMYPTQVIPTLKTIAGAAIPIPLGLSQTDLDRTSSFYFGASQCSIVGGFGTSLYSAVSSKFECSRQCSSRAATHPDRSCRWNNVLFAGAAQCNVIGGQGATLFSSVVPKINCLTECRNRALTHAGRSCTWSGANIKGL
jgi:hypothetical protein